MGTYVALLRGINVGGKNKLPMKDLAAIFAEAGCTNVQTYIQSGNVVFSATPQSTAKRLADAVSKRIADRFGLRVPVVLRSAEELRRVAAENPFLKAGADPGSLHVAFLADLPDKRRVADLKEKPARGGPGESFHPRGRGNVTPAKAGVHSGESFHVRGREIYLHLPHGVARTKLTNNYFDTALASTSTMRNWRTVMKLLALMQAAG